MEELENPPNEEYQTTVTEELLQIVEEFAGYIDKFMFEIVTFLAVIDSSMGLIKDVLGVFGFGGWQMTFFPSFSFIVTMGVFLFGTKKRKGKREADAAELEGLGQAMDMLDDVFDVMEDVAEGLEDAEGEAGALGLGDYSDSEDDDDDDDDDDPNASKIETSVENGMSVAGDSAVDVASEGQSQNTSQQDVKAEAEPPKSAVAKAVGIFITVARIASKLAKKKNDDQQDEQEEDAVKSDGEPEKRERSGEESNAGTSSTGTDDPPADSKPKSMSETRKDDDGLTITEAGAELIEETLELAEAIQDEATRAVELVNEGSHFVQGGTKQVLDSTGALKVGYGLYREADFISGFAKKEGIAVGKSVENKSAEKAKKLKENQIVKATGAEKLGSGTAREAAFIGKYVSQETSKTLQNKELLPAHELCKVSGDQSAERTAESKPRRSIREAKTIHTPIKTQSEIEVSCQNYPAKTKIKTSTGSSTSKQSTSKQAITSESELLGDDLRVIEDSITSSTIEHLQAFKTEEQFQEKRQEDYIEAVEFEPLLQAQPGTSKDSEHLVIESEPGGSDMAATETAPTAAVGEAASQAKEISDEAAKQGVQQTKKKSKGLLQIVMRLVRLVMRVVNKRGGSAASSRSSSVRGSTSSGGEPLGGPDKGKRSADGSKEGTAEGLEGLAAAGMAAASLAMGKGDPKKGKVAAIIAIVMRVVRILSRLRSGQKDEPASEVRSSNDSLDQVSDSEFHDCTEDFATSEIQTQTDDECRAPLLTASTQTMKYDAGSTWTMTTGDSADDDMMDMRTKTSDSEDDDDTDMRTGQNRASFFSSEQVERSQGTEPGNEQLTGIESRGTSSAINSNLRSVRKEDQGTNYRGLAEDSRERTSRKSSEDQSLRVVSISRDDQELNYKGLADDTKERTTRKSTAGQSQRITLKISGGKTDQSASPTSDLNSIFIDIDAPVLLHSTQNENRSLSTDTSGEVPSTSEKLCETAKNKRKTSSGEQTRRTLTRDQPMSAARDLNEKPPKTNRQSFSSVESGLDTADDYRLTSDTLVAYSSSSEDLDERAPFVYRKRSTVRFEDECADFPGYDRDEPVSSVQQRKKGNLIHRRSGADRSTFDGKVDSDLEYRRDYYDESHGSKPSRVRYEGAEAQNSTVRDKASPLQMPHESARLVTDYNKPSTSSINIREAQRFGGSRSSYFGDDESDEYVPLC